MVRGHHATLFPVDLPSWLPEQVVKEMLKRFRKHLVDELHLMLRRTALDSLPFAKHHSRTPSMESASAKSTSADSSDGWSLFPSGSESELSS
jgi:hypothetical protein